MIWRTVAHAPLPTLLRRAGQLPAWRSLGGRRQVIEIAEGPPGYEVLHIHHFFFALRSLPSNYSPTLAFNVPDFQMAGTRERLV